MPKQDDNQRDGGGARAASQTEADHSPDPREGADTRPGAGPDPGPRPDKPHDALFKAILSVPEYLIAILRWLLSAAVVREFADKPPQAVDKSFTAGLRQSHCDVVYRIALRAGRGDPKSTKRSGIGAAERRDLLVRIARHLPLLREEPLYRRVAKDALYYVYWAWGPDAWPFLNRQISLARGEEGARKMKTYREHWLETEGQKYLTQGMAQGEAKGLAEGLAEGRAEGEAKGKAETLAQILEHRFGGLSDAARARITQAPADELEAWTPRIIHVDSPEALFNGDGKEPRH